MKHQNEFIPDQTGVSRRRFFTTSSLALGAAGIGGLSLESVALAGESWPPSPRSVLKAGEVILFQGDSITDASRDKSKTGAANGQPALGNGYAWLAAGLTVQELASLLDYLEGLPKAK